MKSVIIISLALFFLAIELQGAKFTDIEYSIPTDVVIVNSSVPSVEYELHAVESYWQAYTLYPVNKQRQLEAFVVLFNDTHPTVGGWKVAEGCSGFYNPGTHYFVNMNITEGNATRVVRLFD